MGSTTAYSASKGALITLTKTVAVELARYNIRCNAIAPGPTLTAKLQLLTPEQLKSREARIPLGRLGQPEHSAAAVAYLASPGADQVTGQVLCVDGGYTAFWTF